jgi:hypothetical protein
VVVGIDDGFGRFLNDSIHSFLPCVSAAFRTKSSKQTPSIGEWQIVAQDFIVHCESGAMAGCLPRMKLRLRAGQW